MTPIELIRLLDFKSNSQRRAIVINLLDQLEVDFRLHGYSTGANVIVDLGNSSAEKRIGISSHFDRVINSGGANDNGSAVAVCFDIIKKFHEYGSDNLSLRIFFFDEEEIGLKGSSAYLNEFGVKDLIGNINMELVGMGDKFALWPTNANSKGSILETFESAAQENLIATKRFDQIVTNTADHVSFRIAGLADSFTITCISDHDVTVAGEYYDALFRGADNDQLFEILSKAPIFRHYHRPTDVAENVNEESIAMTSSAIWKTVVSIQE